MKFNLLLSTKEIMAFAEWPELRNRYVVNHKEFNADEVLSACSNCQTEVFFIPRRLKKVQPLSPIWSIQSSKSATQMWQNYHSIQSKKTLFIAGFRWLLKKLSPYNLSTSPNLEQVKSALDQAFSEDHYNKYYSPVTKDGSINISIIIIFRG